VLKKTFLLTCITITSVFAFGQNIDSLKLNDNEIPPAYSKPNELICITPHASSVYDQADLYSTFLGKVTRKEYQSFSKKGDSGSILYFEFEKEFKGQGFLNGLLWGDETKPTKGEPDDYYTKGNILIIWSLNLNSDIKKISKAKVMALLK